MASPLSPDTDSFLSDSDCSEPERELLGNPQHFYGAIERLVSSGETPVLASASPADTPDGDPLRLIHQAFADSVSHGGSSTLGQPNLARRYSFESAHSEAPITFNHRRVRSTGSSSSVNNSFPPAGFVASGHRRTASSSSGTGVRSSALGSELGPGVGRSPTSSGEYNSAEFVDALNHIVEGLGQGHPEMQTHRHEGKRVRRTSWANVSSIVKQSNSNPDFSPHSSPKPSPNGSHASPRACKEFASQPFTATFETYYEEEAPASFTTSEGADIGTSDSQRPACQGRPTSFGPASRNSKQTQPVLLVEEEPSDGLSARGSARSMFEESEGIPCEADLNEKADDDDQSVSPSSRHQNRAANSPHGAEVQQPGIHEPEPGHDSSEKQDEEVEVVMQGTMWKKRASLSKFNKVYRLLRHEAKALLSKGDDWISVIRNIETGKVRKLALEAWDELRGQSVESTDVATKKNENEVVWNPRHVQLFRNGTLAWSRLPSTEHGMADPKLNVTHMGPICGSSIEYLGMHHEKDMHWFRVFLVPKVRRQPLTFAAQNAGEAEQWLSCLREACAFKLPDPPQPRASRWDYLSEFWNGVGPPPEQEPPCAVLRLAVVSTSDASASAQDSHASQNPYVLGSLCNHQFRTVTRYGSAGNAHFGQAFNIPIDLEDPDTPVTFEVFNEPEFDDQEPSLLGGITVPLFVFGRREPRDLVLTLTQATETRRGVVNASTRQLVIRGTLDQPTGHLWLPVELPQNATEMSQEINYAALEKQIARLVALINLVVSWVQDIAYVLQWESFWLSAFWFAFMHIWMLFFWSWSLTIIALFFLRQPFNRRPWGKKSNLPEPTLRVEPLPSCATGIVKVTKKDRTASFHVPSQSQSLTLPNEGVAPHHIIHEAERRIVIAGFAPEYLIESVDLPHFTDEHGWEVIGPSSTIWEDGIPYAYHWKVVVDKDTDENGWQYAFHFQRDAEWCRSCDSVRHWVRTRQRIGTRIRRLDQVPDGNAYQGADDRMARADSDSQINRTISGQHHQVEAMITENDMYRRYTAVYLSITTIIDWWMMILEKHKNVGTWKDESITSIWVLILVIVLVLSLVIPTRFVAAGIFSLSFYIGYLMGISHRENRRVFLQSLNEWCSSRRRQQLSLRITDRCSVVDERGISREQVRNWVNTTYRLQLDLRSVDNCMTLTELADMVILLSTKHFQAPRRYRAWHSDVYNNFIEHVPSDSTENEVGSLCYKTCLASSLPPAS